MRILKLLIALTISLTFLACQTEVDKFVPYEIMAPGDFEDVLEPMQNLSVDKIINADDGGIIELNKSVLYVPPLTFLEQNNETAHGDIILRVVEINEKSDLIKYDHSSMNNQGVLLNFETTMRIEGWKNNSPLKFNPESEGITVMVFDSQPESYDVYRRDGESPDASWELTGNEVTLGEISFEYGNYFIDSTGYQFILKDLSWISLQKEINPSAYTSLCLELLESNTPANTRAFILYDNANTCQRLEVSPTSDCAITAVPMEFEGTIVVLAHKGGDQSEAASRRIILSGNQANVELEPIRMSEEEILEFIEKL